MTAEGSLQAYGEGDTDWKFATPDGHAEARNWEQQERMNSDIIKRLNQMEELLQQHEVHHKQHRTELLETKEQLRRLQPFSLDVRSRFLSTFKKHWLGSGKIGSDDWIIIDKTNIEIHEGKAYLDALLYQDRRRWDEDTYKECYGVEWQLVLKLGITGVYFFSDFNSFFEVETSDEVEAISCRGTLRENQQLSDRFDGLYTNLIVAISEMMSPSGSDITEDRVRKVRRLSGDFIKESKHHIKEYRSRQGWRNR